MVDNKKSLDQTLAGIEITAEMAKQKKRFEEQLKNIKIEMEEAMAKKDKEWHTELERKRKEALKKLRREEVEREKMRADWEKLKKEKKEELVRERENAIAQCVESRERMLQHEHEIMIMKLNHANSSVFQKKQFILERLQADNLRMRKQPDSDGCVVM